MSTKDFFFVQGGLADNQVLAAVASLTANLIMRGFSREQEKESDRVGVQIATRMGYAETAMTGFLQTLLTLDNRAPSNRIVALLQTHPGIEERITLLRNYIRDNNISVNNPVLNTQAYQAAVSVLPPKLPLSASTNPQTTSPR